MLEPIGGPFFKGEAEVRADASPTSNPWRDASYEELVAAHLLRDPAFRVKHAPLLERVGETFFGHFILADLVEKALTAWRASGEVPPPPVLVDSARRDGAPQALYASVLGKVYTLPLEGGTHVGGRLVREVQNRMLAQLEEQRARLLSNGTAPEYFKAIREIEALGAPEDAEMGRLTADVGRLLAPSERGVSTGFARLDSKLDCEGIGPGELFLVIGDPNVGKTQFLHHLAREAVFRQRKNTLVLSLETSFRNTKLRILRAELGWTRRQVWADPEGFQRAVEGLGDPPLHVKFAPGGGMYNNAALETDIDRLQQKLGEPIDFVVRDYGELMAAEIAAWQEIRKSYLQFKAMLARLGIPGADACQRNAHKKISNFDLLKDADIGLSLEEDPASPGLLLSKIERIREGEKGDFMFRVDRPTGRIELHTLSPEDLECTTTE